MDLFQNSDEDSGIEMEDMRDIAKEMGQKKKKKKEKNGAGRPSRLSMVIMLIACLISVLAVFANVGGRLTIEDINPLINRLDKLEKNNVNYEQIQNSIAQLSNQVKALEGSVATLEQSGSSLSKELGKFNKQLGQLKASNAPAPVSNQAGAPSVVEKKAVVENRPVTENKAKPQAQPKRVYHEVKQGETLYSISQKYGVTIDQLFDLNNLPENNPISPGQKIIVK
ncbi:hypothetical protein PITCH_A1670026 [uncultured Desulfobacterium sp.]|uniref:LysM domain-containing protein n=1 Tax=uncultured Desulfobacterium sp. TaxID=201089 RepID=A0A445MUH2_9BACT|nr:hypothetical protein PITCH_A1670026 [uncultured Desulfobacterium sp.]